MLRVQSALALCLCLVLCSCGYQWQGFSEPSAHSVLGDGTKTLKMGQVEQASIYPWMPAFLRSLARDEVNLRKLAHWVDGGDADYVLTIRVPSFQSRAMFSDSSDTTLLSTVNVTLELVIYNGTTGVVVWRSGVISYAERYERFSEDESSRTVLRQAMYRAMDRMQQAF